MSTRKIQITLLLLLALTLGCQPAKNQNSSASIGRPARGQSSGRMTPTAGTSSSGVNKQWGEVTSQAGDQAFDQELYLLDYPALSGVPANEQMGFVSSQSGQATGVRFWGNAVTTGGAGINSGLVQFDRNSMILHLEIYDDKAGQTLTDGSTVPSIAIHISPDQPTFVDAGGSMQNGQVYLYFSDAYGTIYMSGVMNGQYFSGNMGYSDSATYGQSRTLGSFNVATCGFFTCY